MKSIKSKQRRDGFVYVLYLGYDWLFKIGRTTNFKNRFKSLQSSNPKLQKTFCIWVVNSYEMEYELHQKFRFQRKDREIFELSQKDLGYIHKRLLDNTPKEYRKRNPKTKKKSKALRRLERKREIEQRIKTIEKIGKFTTNNEAHRRYLQSQRDKRKNEKKPIH